MPFTSSTLNPIFFNPSSMYGGGGGGVSAIITEGLEPKWDVMLDVGTY